MPLVFLLILVLMGNCCAEPTDVGNSTSPDGKVYLTIESAPDSLDAGSGALQIRDAHTKKVLGFFDWGQFGPVIEPKSATVIWKLDSSAFALTWYMARGWTGSKI
jgi:hypothetical protein